MGCNTYLTKHISHFALTVTKGSVLGVVGYTAEIPCELTPKAASDEPTLILWYKDIFGTPIYR